MKKWVRKWVQVDVPDEPTKPETERCVVFREYGFLYYNRETVLRIDAAESCADFLGYEYPDGVIRIHPLIYQDGIAVHYSRAQVDDMPVVRPIAVLFRKASE